MKSTLSMLAFALLIGAQFLAAIVLISRRKAIYGEVEDSKGPKHPSADQMQRAASEQERPAKTAAAQPNLLAN